MLQSPLKYIHCMLFSYIMTIFLKCFDAYKIAHVNEVEF